MFKKQIEKQKSVGAEVTRSNKKGRGTEQANGLFGTSPKTGYTVTMAWEMKQ